MTEEETMKHLEGRLKDNPKSLLFARLADIYIRKGRIDEAIDLCEQGVQYHPYYITGNYILGKAYDTKSDYEKAEAEFKKVISHDKHYLAAHKALGDMMLAMGWEDKAALYYREILRIDPLEEEVRELLNSFTFDSGLSDDIALHDQKGKMNFRPISTLKTGLKEDNDLEKELEDIFTEDDSESVLEESSRSQDQIQEEFTVEEEVLDSEQKTGSDATIESAFDQGDLKQDMVEVLEKGETESKETEELIFDISEKASEENIVEKPSDTVSESDMFSFDLPKEKDEGEREESQPESPSAFDSESIDKVESEIFDQSVEPDKNLNDDFTSVVESEPLTESEVFSFDLGEEKIGKKEGLEEKEQEEEKREESKPKAPPSFDSAQEEEIASMGTEEPGKKENLEEPSLSSEQELTEDEEEFSFDFQEEMIENEDQESISSEVEEETKEVKESDLSMEQEPDLKREEDVVRKTKVDFSTVESETAKTESDHSEETAEPKSPDKRKTEIPSKPVDKINAQEHVSVESAGTGQKQKEQKIISPTLGEIYKAQGQYAKAIRIYETLLQKYPGEKRYQDEIDQLKQKLKS